MSGQTANAVRRCSLCGQDRREDEFTWRAGRRNARGCYCRTCRTAHRQARKREGSR